MIGGLMFAGAALGLLNESNRQDGINDNLRARAQAHRYNALVLRQQAEVSGLAFGAREEQQRRMSRLELGASKAIMAQSGTGSGGSNADVQRQNEILAELDALNIRYEGELEKYKLRAAADVEDYNAQLNLGQQVSGHDSFLGLVGSALGGASMGYR